MGMEGTAGWGWGEGAQGVAGQQEVGFSHLTHIGACHMGSSTARTQLFVRSKTLPHPMPIPAPHQPTSGPGQAHGLLPGLALSPVSELGKTLSGMNFPLPQQPGTLLAPLHAWTSPMRGAWQPLGSPPAWEPCSR